MNRLTAVVVSILILTGCSTTHQFIDVDDVLVLQPKMTKSDIRTSIGKPTEVRAGILLNNGDIIEIWGYQVKEIQERKVIDINKVLPPFFIPRLKPEKEFRPNTWKNEISYGLVFVNDQLVKWGYMGDDWVDYTNSQGDIISPSSTEQGEKAIKRKSYKSKFISLGKILGVMTLITIFI